MSEKISHLDMAEEIAKVLRKWIQYRLDENIPSKTISLEINQATEIIIKSILNPTCKGDKGNQS